MARTGRPGLSQEQKSELWRRWKAGETLSDIGRALGKHAASVFGVVSAKGGFAPVARSRRPGSLSLVEREVISRGLVAGRTFRQLGRDLKRAASTISREVARNGGGLKRNIILSLAEAGLFRLYWSASILDEAKKVILAISKGTADPSRQRRAIERAFPEAMVVPNSGADLIGLLPDPDDEHVLAAAIVARCDTLVTDNLKDFPQDILDRWGIEVMAPDDFISNAMDLDHAVAIGALRDMRARLQDPKYTVSALVLKLEGQGLLQTADFLREYENLI